MPVLLLPFILGGAILGGGAVKGASHACSAPTNAEKGANNSAPLRKPGEVGRPLWATSSDNLDPAFLQKVFAKDPAPGAHRGRN